MNVEMIVGTVKEYISHTGVKPVVMVDYLVRALKKLQTAKYDLFLHVRET